MRQQQQRYTPLAGDAELGLPGVWFTWAGPFDIVNAWRKVGIARNVLAPEMISRAEFINQPAAAGYSGAHAALAATLSTSSPAAATSPARSTRKRVAELAKTPDGMVSGSV